MKFKIHDLGLGQMFAPPAVTGAARYLATARRLLCITLVAVAPAASAAEHLVGQKGKNFTVASVDAKVGDEVLFRNDDAVFHNIFSLTPGQSFDLGAYAPGLSQKIKLDKAGRIEVECAIHPRMKMFIDVSR